MQPPSDSGLEMQNSSVYIINRDDSVTYRCRGGKKFESDLSKVNVSATCILGDDWEEPGDWGKCVESESDCLSPLMSAISTSN